MSGPKWFPEFRLRDLIFLTVLHNVFGGVLGLLRMMEQVDGLTWGPYHLIAAFAYFPSWPLFATLDGPFLSSPAGPLANSFLFVLLLISVVTAIRGGWSTVADDGPAVPRPPITVVPPTESRFTEGRTLPDPSLALTLFASALLSILLGGYFLLDYQCFGSAEPLSSGILPLLILVTGQSPFQTQLEICSAYTSYGERLFLPLVIAIMVPYGWGMLQAARSVANSARWSSLKYITLVLFSLVVASAWRQNSAPPETTSNEQLSNETLCDDQGFPRLLTAEDASEFFDGDTRHQILGLGGEKPYLRALLYRQHDSIIGLEPARTLLWSCALRKIRAAGLRSEKLNKTLVVLFSNAALRGEAATTLAASGPPEERASDFLSLLESADPAVRQAASTVLRGYGDTIVPFLVEWKGKYGGSNPELFEFFESFSVRSGQTVDYLIGMAGSGDVTRMNYAVRFLGGVVTERGRAAEALLTMLSRGSGHTSIGAVRAVERLRDAIPGHEQLFLTALDGVNPALQATLVRSAIAELPPGEISPEFIVQLVERYGKRRERRGADPRCGEAMEFLAPAQAFIHGVATPYDLFQAHLKAVDRHGQRAVAEIFHSGIIHSGDSSDSIIRGTMLELLWHSQLDLDGVVPELRAVAERDPAITIRLMAAILLVKTGHESGEVKAILGETQAVQTCMDTRGFALILTRAGMPGATVLLESLPPESTSTANVACERAAALAEIPRLPPTFAESVLGRLREMRPSTSCVFTGLIRAIGRSSSNPPSGAIDFLGSLLNGSRFSVCYTTPWAWSVSRALLDLRADTAAEEQLVEGLRSLIPGELSRLESELRGLDDPAAVRILTKLQAFRLEHDERIFRPTKKIDEQAKGLTCPDREGKWIVAKTSSPLHFFAMQGDLVRTKGHFTAHPEDINGPDSNCFTPLLRAIQQGHDDVVTFLLEHGADPSIPLPDGSTPLMLAVSVERPILVKKLLREGASPNTVNVMGDSALARALHRQYKSRDVIVPILLDHKVDPNAGVDPYGGGPVMLLAWSAGGIDLVNKLIGAGGRLDHRNAAGDTILHLAARSPGSGYEALVEAGADPDAPNCNGLTPEEIRAGIRR